MDLADMTNISIRILYENKLFKKFCAWSLHLCTSRHFPCISLVMLVIFQLNMRNQQLEGIEMDWISKRLLNVLKLRQLDLVGIFFFCISAP